MVDKGFDRLLLPNATEQYGGHRTGVQGAGHGAILSPAHWANGITQARTGVELLALSCAPVERVTCQST
jgi:hypothetical protein